MKQFYFKMIKIPRLATFLGILFLLAGQGMQAQVTSTTTGGNWNDPTTWVGGVVPAATDNVVINTTGTNSVIISADVTMNAGTTVTVSTGAILKTTSTSIVSIFDTLIVNGTYSNSSTVTVRSSLEGSGTFDNSLNNSSYLNISGAITITTLNVGSTNSNTVNYNGGNQIIKFNSNYRTLITSGTGTKTLTMSAAVTAQGLTVNAGAPLIINTSNGGSYTFTMGGFGSFVYDTLNCIDTANITVSGGNGSTIVGLTNYGYIKTNTLTVGTSTQTGYTIYNYGTITTTGFASGTVGIFSNYATGILNYNGGGIPTAMTFNASTPGNTVIYGATSTTVRTPTDGKYSNLTFSNSGIKTITNLPIVFNSNTLCTGTLSILATAQCALPASTTLTVDKFIARGVGQVTGSYNYTTNNTNSIFTNTTGSLSVTNSSSVLSPTWTGTTNNLWSTASNWSTNTVPQQGDAITISLGNPVLDTDFIVGGTLTLSGTASLTVASNASLTVYGVADFGGRPVTFKSDATGTARFGKLLGTLTNATNVTVERFIPAKRAFRLLSSPVTTTTSINANWQEGLGTTAGLGTHITGTGGASNGFDPSGTNNASLFTYDNANQLWAEVTNTSTNVLSAGTPYLIMVRGDRNTILSDNAAAASNTTLRATGTLKTGSVTLTTLTTGLNQTINGFSLIGNPYQSPVDMKVILKGTTSYVVNLNPFYWVWDPTLGTRGAYVARDVTASTNNITSAVNNFLQPGQACFVQTTATLNTTKFVFTEDAKFVPTNLSVFRAVAPISDTATPASASPSASIRLTLYNKTALANQGTPSDGAVVLFNAASANEVDANDCSKMTNLDENLAFNTNGNLLSIEHRAVPTAADEIQLAITQYRAKDYTLVAQGTNVDGVTAYLVDQYTKTSTALPASGSINYNFTVDPSNANSSAANRFKIIFQDATSATEFTENEVKVYPNPSTGGMVTISLPFIQQESKVSILNFAGETIYSTTIAAGENAAINPNKSLAVGIYFVKMEQAGKTVTKKLIIK